MPNGLTYAPFAFLAASLVLFSYFVWLLFLFPTQLILETTKLCFILLRLMALGTGVQRCMQKGARGHRAVKT